MSCCPSAPRHVHLPAGVVYANKPHAEVYAARLLSLLKPCCPAVPRAVHLPAGVVYANKPHAEVLGVARLLDEQHRLEAVISFGPVPGTRQRMLARADAVCGEIYQLPRAAHLQVG
jgi:hypothetical protein